MAVKGFVYRGTKRTTEDVKRAATMSTGNYDSMFIDGVPVFKVKEGENVIRIMPPTWPDEDLEKWGKDWAIIASVHNNIGVDRGTFLCLDAMRGEPCPICEIRREATDDEERFALSPNKRAVAWLINRDDEGAGPLLWSMPIKKIFKVINARSIDRKSGALVLIDDPDEGFDVIFNCEGAGKKNADYTGVDVDRDPSPLHDKEELQDRWMKYIMDNPLPSVLNWPEPEYIEKVLMGKSSRRADADEAEAEGGAPPARSRRGREAETEEGESETRRTPTRRGRGGEPPEEDETPPEAEAEAPPRRTRRSEPEEETEPAPRTTRRRAEPEEEAPPRRTARRNGPEEETEAEPTPRRIRRVEPEEEEVPEPSRRARGALERLRPQGRQGATSRRSE